MTNKKELNVDKLEKVTGGTDEYEALPSCGAVISPSEVKSYIEQNVYVVDNNNPNHWALAIIKRVLNFGNFYELYCIDTSNHGQLSVGSRETEPNDYWQVNSRKVTIYKTI